MSCLNSNCTQGCNCGNCCPPVTPPTPPVPPTCVGTDCEELYDAACVNYTGPAITCMNIATNTNLNSIIQTIAANICLCCNKTECINPLRVFFERVRFTYDSLFVQDDTITLDAVVDEMLKAGLVLKKCQYCCPDAIVYALSLTSARCTDIANYLKDLSPANAEPNHNTWTNYNSCATTFLTLFDPTLDDTHPAITVNGGLCEYGGFNNVSGLCELNSILTQFFTTAEITEIMKAVYINDLVVYCDPVNGNTLIGALSALDNYYVNMTPIA